MEWLKIKYAQNLYTDISDTASLVCRKDTIEQTIETKEQLEGVVSEIERHLAMAREIVEKNEFENSEAEKMKHMNREQRRAYKKQREVEAKENLSARDTL